MGQSVDGRDIGGDARAQLRRAAGQIVHTGREGCDGGPDVLTVPCQLGRSVSQCPKPGFIAGADEARRSRDERRGAALHGGGAVGDGGGLSSEAPNDGAALCIRQAVPVVLESCEGTVHGGRPRRECSAIHTQLAQAIAEGARVSERGVGASGHRAHGVRQG